MPFMNTAASAVIVTPTIATTKTPFTMLLFTPRLLLLPNSREISTDAPVTKPMMNEVIIQFVELVAPTAAKASFEMNLPTITISVTLYNC